MLKSFAKLALLSGAIMGLSSVSFAEQKTETPVESVVTLSHLDHLYEQRTFDDGSKAGFIHIYSEYPDYEWVKDPLEGTSALDDVARAALVYAGEYQKAESEEVMAKLESLVNFMLHVQNDNGYFNNFIYPDNSVNETYKTSVAEPNWWTWRGVWVLAETLPLVRQSNADLAAKMDKAIFTAIDVIYRDFVFKREITETEGVEVAEWLPHQAGDQAAVLLLALDRAYKLKQKPEIAEMMKALAEGIMVMQVRDVESEMHGALLSWKNLWHGYGNSQAYALLEAGMTLQDRELVKAAFTELDHFHPFLLEQGQLNWFTVKKEQGRYSFIEKEQFAQIAYAVRPVVYANIRAYQISRDSRYIDQAVDFAMWFFKQNPAGAAMYNKDNGRGFDGVNSPTEFNRNSGAESTIEALLTLQMLESEPAAKALLYKKLEENELM